MNSGTTPQRCTVRVRHQRNRVVLINIRSYILFSKSLRTMPCRPRRDGITDGCQQKCKQGYLIDVSGELV